MQIETWELRHHDTVRREYQFLTVHLAGAADHGRWRVALIEGPRGSAGSTKVELFDTASRAAAWVQALLERRQRARWREAGYMVQAPTPQLLKIFGWATEPTDDPFQLFRALVTDVKGDLDDREVLDERDMHMMDTVREELAVLTQRMEDATTWMATLERAYEAKLREQLATA